MTTFTAIHESRVTLPITRHSPREIAYAERCIVDLKRMGRESSDATKRAWCARQIMGWRRLVREYRHAD